MPKTRSFGWAVFLAAALFFSVSSFAAPPQKVLYQGTLRRSGAVYTGNATFVFRLTDSSGGTEYWTSGSTVVAVSMGLFRYPIGVDNAGGTGLSGKPLSGVDWPNITPYIEVTVDGTVLTPREAMASVPYALSNEDTTKLLKSGDAMTGPLTLSGSTLTVSGGAFSVGGSTFAVLSGRVGIGTTNPSYSLDVQGDVRSTGVFVGSGAKLSGLNFDGAPAATGMTLYNDGGTLKWNGSALAVGSSVSGTTGFFPKFTDATSLGNSVLFESGGNVGVGTTVPGAKLDVSGSARFGSGSSKSTFTSTGDLILASGSSVTLSGGDGFITSGSSITASAFFGYGGNLTGLPSSETNTYASSKTFAGSVLSGGSITASAFFGYGGNLTGISPGESNTYASSKTFTANAFSVGGSSLVVMGGNVGVGTSNPSYPIVVQNSGTGTTHNSNIMARLQATAAGRNTTLQFSDNVTYANFISMLGGDMLFTTSNPSAVDALMLKGTGRVGVGVTTPAARLHISSAGAVSTDTILQVSSGAAAGQELLSVKGDGKVGIATSSPATNLDVNGSVQFGSGSSKSTFTTSGALFMNSGSSITLSGSTGFITSASSINASAFFGSGAGLTGVAASQMNAAGLINGPLNSSILPSTVAYTSSANTFSSSQTITADAFSVGGATLVVAGGKVGIGTVGPAGTLDVRGALTGGSAVLTAINTGTSGTPYGADLESIGSNAGGANTGLYVRALNGGTNYAIYSSGGINYFSGNAGIATSNPVTNLEVNGNAQFGSNAAKSTFTTTGALTLASDAALTLSGAAGSIAAASSITASAFFGDGSRLTGIPSTASVSGTYLQKAGDAMSGPLTMVSNSTITITGNAFSVGASTFVVAGGRVGVGLSNPAHTFDVYGTLHQTAGNGAAFNTTDFSGDVNAGANGVYTTGVFRPSSTAKPGLAMNSAGAYNGLIQNDSADTWSLGYGAAITTLGTRVLSWTGSGSVGISTASPTSKLHIHDGDIRVSTTVGAASRGIYFQDGSLQTTAAAGGNLWADRGSSNISNTNSGNVGIGTSSPSSKLHVSNGVITVDGTGAGITIGGFGVLTSSSAAGLTSTQTFSGQNTFTAQTNFTNALSTQAAFTGFSTRFGASVSNGHIQIGSNGMLDSSNSDDQTSLESNAAGGSVRLCTYPGGVRTCPIQTNSAGIALFSKTTSTQGVFTGWNSRQGPAEGAGSVAIGGEEAGRLVLTYDSGTQEAGIESTLDAPTGNILMKVRTLGTSLTPLKLLGTGAVQVLSSGGGPAIPFQIGASSLVVTSAGRLGLGTASPQAPLSLGVGVGPRLLLYDNGSTYHVGFFGDTPGGGDNAFLAHNAGALVFGRTALSATPTFAGEWMRITNAGNVGIGTPSPSATLHISSAPTSGSSVLFQVGGGTITALGSGNVGIGTTNPAYRLDVQGDVRSTGVFVGSGAGLTGIPSSSSIVGVYVAKAGDGMTGPLTLNGSTLTIRPGSAISPLLVSTSNTAGVVGLYVSGENKVGIGITNPLARLSIGRYQDSADPLKDYALLGSSNATMLNITAPYVANQMALIGFSTLGSGIDSNYGNNAVFGTVLVAGGNSLDFIWANKNAYNATTFGSAAESMRLTNAGNLGIGTTSPGTLFQVAAGTFSVASNGNIGIGTTNPQSSFEMWSKGNSRNNIRLISTTTTPGDNIFSIVASAESDANPGRSSAELGFVASYDSRMAEIAFRTSDNFGAWSTERMRVTFDGHVGIGTAVICSTCALQVVSNGGGISAKGTIDGNLLKSRTGLAIGVISPQNPLEIWGQEGLRNNIRLVSTMTAPNLNMFSIIATGEGDAQNGRSSAEIGFIAAYDSRMAEIAFKTSDNYGASSTERMRVTWDGRVGIATGAPQGLFDVGGGSLTVKTTGNVGIGTSTPSSKLHISNGVITVDGTGAGITIGGFSVLTSSSASALTSTQTFSGENTFTAKSAFSNALSTQAVFSGYSAYSGAGANRASVMFGAAAATSGRVDYDGSGILHIDNAGDGLGNNIEFRTRTSNPATLNTNLILDGYGDVYSNGGQANTTQYGSTASAVGNWSTAIGQGANSTAQEATTLGATAIAGISGVAVGYNSQNVERGFAAGVASRSGSYGIAIGNTALATGYGQISIGNAAASTDNTSIAIGYDARAYGSGVGIGRAASASGAVAIGDIAQASGGGTAIGYQSSATFQGSAIGSYSRLTANGQFVSGSEAVAVSDVYFGKGVQSAAPVGYTIHGTSGTGTDIAGGALTLSGGEASGGAAGGSLIFQTSQAGASGVTPQTATTRMIIGGNGRIGVGTTAPSSTLHVSSAATAAATAIFIVSSGTAAGQELLLVQKDGKVGLGSSAPAYPLHIRSDDPSAIFVEGIAGNPGISIKTGSTAGTLAFKDAAGTTNSQIMNASGQMYVQNINGVINFTGVGSATMMSMTSAGFQIGTSSFMAATNGNVGIGISAPTSRLHINDGDIRISTTSGSRGIIFQDGTTQTTAAGGGVSLGSTQTFSGINTFLGGVAGFSTATVSVSFTNSPANNYNVGLATATFLSHNRPFQVCFRGSATNNCNGTGRMGWTILVNGAHSAALGTSSSIGLVSEQSAGTTLPQNMSGCATFPPPGAGTTSVSIAWYSNLSGSCSIVVPGNDSVAHLDVHEIASP